MAVHVNNHDRALAVAPFLVFESLIDKNSVFFGARVGKRRLCVNLKSHPCSRGPFMVEGSSFF